MVLEEFRDLLSRPEILNRYRLAESAVNEFFESILEYSTLVDFVPHVFDLPRDPDDAHYIDLAVAANAKLVVSRDKDLLSLGDPTREKGAELSSRFPGLRILTPPELLQSLVENPNDS